MSRKTYLTLYLISAAVLGWVASLQSVPGYMDADYYFLGGMRLADGYGFTENVLWNYLDDPVGLPHPSHTYWMPLTSIVVWAGLKLLPWLGLFAAAQVMMVVVAALAAPLTAALCYRLTGRADWAKLAAVFAIFPGFYLPFLPTTDAFGLYLVLGAAFFLTAASSSRWRVVGLGALAGLLHLGRADGVLWVLIVAVVLWEGNLRVWLIHGLQAATGYLVIMAPWLVRNVANHGSLTPPGGGQTMWLLEYNELFSYPASLLTAQRWLASGWDSILSDRVEALGQNLVSTLAVMGLVFVLPLTIAGWGLHRKQPIVRAATWAWAVLVFVMSFVFPYSGVRGGFFHSSAALAPVGWALAPAGLDRITRWAAARRRTWQARQAFWVLGGGFALFAVVLSASMVSARFLGPETTWGADTSRYQAIEAELDQLGADPTAIIMVGNPPAYAALGRPAMVVPNGDVDTLQAAAQRYGAVYVVIEADHPPGLDDLYQFPQDIGFLVYVGTVEDAHFFQVVGP